MPPLKEYRFEDMMNSNVEVVIKSYSLKEAYEILVMITKHPADFKCTSV
jgi:hypothetical protein